MTKTTYTVSFGRSEDQVQTKSVGPTYSARLRKDGWKRVRRYPHERAGQLVAVKIRWQRTKGELTRPRVFTSYRLTDDVPVPLLLADDVQDAIEHGRRVWVTESHSDVEALLAAGVLGTTNWGAAGSWSREDAEQLRDARVVLVRHRDEAGERFASDVRRSLDGIARSVRVVEPVVGSDVREHLEAGHGLDELVPVDDA